MFVLGFMATSDGGVPTLILVVNVSLLPSRTEIVLTAESMMYILLVAGLTASFDGWLSTLILPP